VSIFDGLNQRLLLSALALLSLLGLIAYALKKYRQRMYKSFSGQTRQMEDTVPSIGTYWQDTEMEEADMPETIQAPTASIDRLQQVHADTTLDEAKLLVGVNRTAEAINHLKTNIEQDPKASIQNWLYLLEILRNTQQKDEFEHFAGRLHQTFNVEAPTWVETSVSLMPQSLEQFPEITKKLSQLWPMEDAKLYLRQLINENRDGARAGFSKGVLEDMLILIAVLDNR
jgi:hypothetical protein